MLGLSLLEMPLCLHDYIHTLTEPQHSVTHAYRTVAFCDSCAATDAQDPADRWDEMFSRGIDPDVLDPSKCHNHPDAPPEWPTKDEIVCYALKVWDILTI